MLKFIQHNLFPGGQWGCLYGALFALLESVWIAESKGFWQYPLDIFLLTTFAVISYGLAGLLLGTAFQALLGTLPGKTSRRPAETSSQLQTSRQNIGIRIGQKGKVVMVLGLFLFSAGVLGFLHPSPFQATTPDRSTASSPGAPPPLVNILLITIDTLRPDHLSAYGYTRPTSPRIDQLAREGTLFSQAISQEPQTGPSHVSIFTSQYPNTHGVLINGDRFEGAAVTLAELLQARGYLTGAFLSGYPLDARFGLNRGFETYDDDFSPIRGLYQLAGWKMAQKVGILSASHTDERRAEKTNRRVFKWLENHHGDPFFLWVHYFDPHGPYNPPPPFAQRYDPSYQGRFKNYYNFDSVPDTSGLSQKEVHHIISLYDGEIRYTDEQVGFLLDKLKELNVYDKTLIILTADHGEDLNEHKLFEHSAVVYDTTARIPLIFKGAANLAAAKAIPPGQIVSGQVQSIDIVPTILDLLDIPPGPRMQGESLLPLIARRDADRRQFAMDASKAMDVAPPIATSKKAYIQTHSPAVPKTKLAIRVEGWKFIYTWDGGEVELYDLGKDPYEQTNLALEGSVQSMVRDFEKELSFWKEPGTEGKREKGEGRVSEEVKKKLRSLGYFQ